MALINKIIFNSGDELLVDSGDIVIFVGPNNVGKSQALRDINTLCGREDLETKVVKSIDLSIPSLEDMTRLVRENSQISHNGPYIEYSGINYSFLQTEIDAVCSHDHTPVGLGATKSFFVSYLNAEGRLSLVYPAPPASVAGPKEHPIQYYVDLPEKQRELSNYFEAAFGIPLSIDFLNGEGVPLRLGKMPNLDELVSRETIEAFSEARSLLSHLEMLHEQGDGMRSFVGVLLSIAIEHLQAFIVDEPEAFLHPPQAYLLGKIIGGIIGGERQCFLATHSRDIVRGLIDTYPTKVKVIRISREGFGNRFEILESEEVLKLWSDPILNYSNIMESMFYESVVLCESDADCMMYSRVHSQLAEQERSLSQVQFIHCGGKSRMHRVVETLNSLGIQYRVVPDLDILSSREECERLYKACGGDWDEIAPQYNQVVSSIRQREKRIQRNEVQDILDGCDSQLSDTSIRLLQELLKSSNPWEEVKKYGIQAFPGGDITRAFEELNRRFKDIGIYMVPVGELESFSNQSGKHGPAWVAEVLEKKPNLMDDEYRDLREFVASWGL